MLFVVFAARADARRSKASPVAALEGVSAAARAVQGAAAEAPADTAAEERRERGGRHATAAPARARQALVSAGVLRLRRGRPARPFKPLLDVDSELEGPRFDELELTGIFTGEDGDGMVVVEDARRKGYFLKRGDLVGKATLVDIGADEATFEVRDYGISRRETLKLQRPEETP